MNSEAPTLIGVTGYARVGKDTFAEGLAAHAGYSRMSFAQPVREMLYAQNPLVDVDGLRVRAAVDHLGWEAAKDRVPELRRLLQSLGTQAGRELLGANVWVDAAMRRLDACPAPKVVFADVRFPNEADAIRARGGIIVRVERDGHGPLNMHESETSMDDYEWDYVVRNNGTVDELHQKAADVIRKERGEFTLADYHRDVPTFQPERLENGRTLRLPAGTTEFTVDL